MPGSVLQPTTGSPSGDALRVTWCGISPWCHSDSPTRLTSADPLDQSPQFAQRRNVFLTVTKMWDRALQEMLYRLEYCFVVVYYIMCRSRKERLSTQGSLARLNSVKLFKARFEFQTGGACRGWASSRHQLINCTHIEDCLPDCPAVFCFICLFQSGVSGSTDLERRFVRVTIAKNRKNRGFCTQNFDRAKIRVKNAPVLHSIA